MTTEELRSKLMSRIDSLLARSFLVWGEDRDILSALRGYAAQMTTPDLDKLLTHFARRQASDPPNPQGVLMLSPYPTQFPVEAASLIVQARSGNVPRNQVIHACVDVAHYACGQAFPDGPIPVGAVADCGPCEPCNDDELCDHLQHCCDCCTTPATSGAKMKALSLPWGIIMAAITRVLLEWLARQE